MWKGILYSVITLAFYYIIIEGIKLLTVFILTRDFFSFINDTYLLFLDTLFYIILISLAIFFVKKSKKIYYINTKIKANIIFQIFALAIFIRLMEDPILRIDIILGLEDFPLIKNQNETHLLELFSSILSTVILGPIFEELLFRRIILNYFIHKYLIFGIFISSLLFTLIHVKFPFINYTTFVNLFVFGVIASIIYLRKGLFYSILFHVSCNVIWVILNLFNIDYWNILQKLNFGFLYWFISVISLVFVLYYIYINVRFLLNWYNKY